MNTTAKRWDSVEEFNRIQKIWSTVWVTLFLIGVGLFVLNIVLVFTLPSIRSVQVTHTTINGSITTTEETAQNAANDAKTQGLLDEMRDASQIYFRTHNNYGLVTTNCSSGMFTDTTSGMSILIQSIISSGSTPTCNSSGTAWAASATLSNGNYWCADSSDTSAETQTPLGSSTSCQ